MGSAKTLLDVRIDQGVARVVMFFVPFRKNCTAARDGSLVPGAPADERPRRAARGSNAGWCVVKISKA